MIVESTPTSIAMEDAVVVAVIFDVDRGGWWWKRPSLVRLDPSDRSFHRSRRSDNIHDGPGGDLTSTCRFRHGGGRRRRRHERMNNSAVEGFAFVESPGYIPST